MTLIKLSEARQLVDFSLALSKRNNLNICIAIYDPHANLMAFERMDGSMLGSIDLAMRKAKTACLFRIATHVLGKLSQPNMPVWSIELSNGNLTTIAGGIPIRCNDELYGSIGISGGTAEEDYEIAKQSVDLFLNSKGLQK
ncbi:hypothetical protein AMD27_11365 [Acinetobacter sp. TGL-Y2]|uniref:GlcG/HbpS family heme-binding protein n=1 Tax=Acinetobacter sp. TGL-Y2 TaxID=1407071 RepID=UPI0007A6752A|nr:heme-binding protein [Acinetobacter sp. TGL-Y2]AMW79428.1 hypothetical protein AMD27_11365 [Acinetobacter sp. TGL-Y2]